MNLQTIQGIDVMLIKKKQIKQNVVKNEQNTIVSATEKNYLNKKSFQYFSIKVLTEARKIAKMTKYGIVCTSFLKKCLNKHVLTRFSSGSSVSD